MTEDYYKGHKVGYDQGIEEGKKLSTEEAKSKFQEGYNKGYRIGHSEGYDEGESANNTSCDCEFSESDALKVLSEFKTYYVWHTRTVEDQLKVESLQELFKNATLHQIECYVSMLKS